MITLPLPLWIFIAVLAAYRMAYLTSIDSGPAFVFRRLREWVTRKYGHGSWQAQGASCFFCQSVWYAFPAALALFGLQYWIIQVVLLWLGLAGACTIIHWAVLLMMSRVNSA